MQNLERWYWRIYLQGSNGDADIENRFGNMVGEIEGGMNGDRGIETYITISKRDSQWKFALWLRNFKLVLCDNLELWDGMGGRREVQKGGDICIPKKVSEALEPAKI